MKVDPKQFKLLDVGAIDLAPWNYKDPDARITEQLQASLESHGQVQSLLVRKKSDGRYEVCDGNHRIEQFREHGVRKAFVYDAGSISVAEAIELSMVLNDGHHPSNDFLKASALRTLLAADKEAASRLPYSQEYLSMLLSITDNDPKWTPAELRGEPSENEHDADMVNVQAVVSREFFEGAWQAAQDAHPDEGAPDRLRARGTLIEAAIALYLQQVAHDGQ